MADGRPTYGGSFLWLNGMDTFPVPRDAMYMTGAGGQQTIMIPSHGLVVVRLGEESSGVVWRVRVSGRENPETPQAVSMPRQAGKNRRINIA